MCHHPKFMWIISNAVHLNSEIITERRRVFENTKERAHCVIHHLPWQILVYKWFYKY